MQNIQAGSMMLHPETLSLFYDLGQHVAEVTKEGGILIAEPISGNTPLEEAVSLDQDEAYRLFLVLKEWFTENDRPVKGSEPCS